MNERWFADRDGQFGFKLGRGQVGELDEIGDDEVVLFGDRMLEVRNRVDAQGVRRQPGAPVASSNACSASPSNIVPDLFCSASR